MGSKWKRLKRRIRRLLHPNVMDMKAAMRLGRMQGKREASVQLPPIFGERPVYIPLYICAPSVAQPVIPSPRGRFFQQYRHAYSATVELPRVKRTVLERYDGPPPEDETPYETPAFLK